jgi:hypothetical protein
MVKSTRETRKSANRFPAPASSRNAEDRVAQFVVQALTHIHGIQAFGSQLLCEQVVAPALRRMNFRPDPDTGLLPEEDADVYGIPFSVIPFKGRIVDQAAPEEKAIPIMIRPVPASPDGRSPSIPRPDIFA